MGITKRQIYLRLNEGKLEEINKYSSSKENEANKRRFVKSISLVSEMGFMIALPLLGGVVLGKVLDDKFLSYPKLTLSFLILGMIFSFTNLYFLLKEYTEKEIK